jgi:hypothetical protein
MKHTTLGAFLTDVEIERCLTLWRELRGTGRFARTVAEQVIAPNLPRINAVLGQENDARYLAYAVEAIFEQAVQ